MKNTNKWASRKNNSNNSNKLKETNVDYEFSKVLNTSLGNKGYSILKSELTETEIQLLKDKLTVKPVSLGSQLFGAANQLTFPIYRESSKKIYVPRYFGEKEFGPVKECKLPESEDITVEFNGNLRDVQTPVVETFLKHVKNDDARGGGGLLELPCAAGKCLGKNTPIIMFDGSIKMVQNIVVGDILMGDDSTPRNVLSTTTGNEVLYRVEKRGFGRQDAYIVNESHILSLKQFATDKINDIPVKDYLLLAEKEKQALLGFRVPLLFEEKEVEIDPYTLGFWLGYHSHNMEDNIQEIMEINKNRGFLKKYGLNNKEKNIPMHYKCNSPKNQQKLLAGILNSHGKYRNNHYIVYEKNDILREDIIFVARSLGFHVVFSEPENKIQIYSDLLLISPTENPDLTYDIRLRKMDIGHYYGFEIDGNRRFVLGDFSVTHNTVISINIITQLKKKTLVIVNKEFLMNQWIERIRDFAPKARIGKIQGSVIDIEDKDIVIGMLQSISMKDYSADTFASFGLTIFDEVHHISSEVFSAALFKIVSKYMLGLSATMERKDGTTYVFKLFLGDIIYKGSTDEQHDVCVRAIEYVCQDREFNEVEMDYRGNPQYSKMIVKLCEFGPRSDFIIRVVKDLLVENPNKQIMIIGHNRSLLTYLYDALKHQNITNIGYYVGGMKQSALDESSTKQIVLSSYSMAAEALDIKTLSTLVMVTPKTDIIQCIGRILRVRHSQPIVVDIVDKHDLFQNQWAKRRTYYKKCNYRIRMIDSRNYTNMQEMEQWKTVFEPKIHRNLCSKNNDENGSKGIGQCLINIDDLQS